MNRTNQPDRSVLIPIAAGIRDSSEMQNKSFSLDAKLRQIKEPAERDGVKIIKVYADPAQSANKKRFHLEIIAMHDVQSVQV